MKINNWSVVASPNGVSLKPVTSANTLSNGEVCVSMRQGELHISVYRDGRDEPLWQFALPRTVINMDEGEVK
jgi:hypothetical protein